MPRGLIDYSQSSIYKICCLDPSITDIYVGSTTNLRSRKQGHKQRCYNEKSPKYNYYVYQFIRQNGGWDNFDMIQVEKYNAVDIHNLYSRERYWIEELKASLNKVIPTRTKKEYYKDNKEVLAEKMKIYREQNKEVLAEKSKNYYLDNKEVLAEKSKIYREQNKQAIAEKKKIYREQNKEVLAEKKKIYREQNKEKIADNKKKYYEDNKQEILKYHKEYYQEKKEAIAENGKIYREQNKEVIAKRKKIYGEKNKQAIAEKMKEKFNCECGGKYTNAHKAKHYKTNKHIEFMNKE